MEEGIFLYKFIFILSRFRFFVSLKTKLHNISIYNIHNYAHDKMVQI
jgi:hypothetical protein